MKTFILVKYLLSLFLTCFLMKCSNALTWDDLRERAEWGTNEISNILEPYVVQNFPSSNVSQQCVRSLIAYAEGIKDFKPWAVKMFDATGKFPSSFLRGTYADFGSFDDCLSLEVGTDGKSGFFKGEFCMLSLTSQILPIRMHKPDKEYYLKTHGYPPDWAMKTTQIMENDWGRDAFGLHLGVCFPSTCSEEDLTTIISAYTDPVDVQVSLSDCQISEPKKWRTVGKFAVFSTFCLLVLVIIGTLLDMFERQMKQEMVLCRGTKRKILLAFSLVSNFEILTEKKVTDNSLAFIHGMKFWTVMWVLALHMVGYVTLWMIKRYRNYSQVQKQEVYLIMLENSLPNTTYFIFLNGFLMAYSLKNKKLKSSKDSKRNKSLLMVILLKYLRMIPSIVFLMLMTFVIPVTYSGPIWNSTWNTFQDKCLKYGWANILFVTNFLTFNDCCWMHMWVPSALMQYFLICLPLLYMAKRYPKLTILLGVLISIGCGIRDFLVSIQFEFAFPTLNSLGEMEAFMNFVRQIYFKPYNHFATFGLGMIFGWIDLKSFKMNKLFLTIGWSLYVLYSLALYFVINYPTKNLVFFAFHNAFRGVFFSLQIGWLMYTCLNETAGILGKFFSWKALIPFSKILNCVTMFHPLLIVAFEASRRERFYFSKINYFHHSLALIVYSFLVGFIAFLVVESPFSRLCDILEGKSSEKSTNRQSENNCAVEHCNGLASKEKKM